METAVSMSYERENSPEIPALKSAVGTQENTGSNLLHWCFLLSGMQSSDMSSLEKVSRTEGTFSEAWNERCISAKEAAFLFC